MASASGSGSAPSRPQSPGQNNYAAADRPVAPPRFGARLGRRRENVTGGFGVLPDRALTRSCHRLVLGYLMSSGRFRSNTGARAIGHTPALVSGIGRATSNRSRSGYRRRVADPGDDVRPHQPSPVEVNVDGLRFGPTASSHFVRQLPHRAPTCVAKPADVRLQLGLSKSSTTGFSPGGETSDPFLLAPSKPSATSILKGPGCPSPANVLARARPSSRCPPWTQTRSFCAHQVPESCDESLGRLADYPSDQHLCRCRRNHALELVPSNGVWW